MSEQPTAWKQLIDEWVVRESKLHPSTPVEPDSVRVRDVVEMEDSAYVLVSFDVERPWPKSEDTPGDLRAGNTAVIQAMRVRQPWIERDSTSSLAEFADADRTVRVYEHLLGGHRAWSGYIEQSDADVTVNFERDNQMQVTVVDGWFLAITPEAWRISSLNVDSKTVDLWRIEAGAELMADERFPRSAGGAMYFSPLDLRAVTPIVTWQRQGDTVAVVSSVERYDEGGIIRLRIDGVRVDDDCFLAWPRILVKGNEQLISSAACGEYALADTLQVDIGFKPWIPDNVDSVSIVVENLRSTNGIVPPITVEIPAEKFRS